MRRADAQLLRESQRLLAAYTELGGDHELIDFWATQKGLFVR